MNIKAIKVEIEKGAAKEDVARQIGDAVAEAIGTAEAEDDAPTGTAADNLDREAVKELMETEDFKAFYDEVTNRVNDLVNLIQANKARYNCSVVISLTSLMGKDSNLGGTALCGRADSLHETIDKLLKEEPIRTVVIKKCLDTPTES
ncbi:MAG: hypothetical protein HFJ87_10460 [Muribaculaceae bacterium]|nr:hypothetical protein [Muribaculaceae bacterium]